MTILNNDTINPNTKIAHVLKINPAALEAIVSISPRFQKLRNPILRKLMAGRTTLAMASKLGGCNVQDFFDKLAPLGFKIDSEVKVIEEDKKPLPAFITSLQKEKMTILDVRPLISAGDDPLSLIMENVKILKEGHVLKIINSFEPAPLIIMLQKKGFETYVDELNTDVVETYFYKPFAITSSIKDEEPVVLRDWENIKQKFTGKTVEIDVRNMDMPLPMMTILESLENLPAGKALFVYHKRIPVFLLPELADRGFDYRVNEIADGEVNLLIFKN